MALKAQFTQKCHFCHHLFNLISWRKRTCGNVFTKRDIHTNNYISLQFPAEINTRGDKTASTCNHLPTQLWLQLHMFRFPDITSLLSSSACTELDLNESREKHDSQWKSWKTRDKKQAKSTCLRLRFYITFAFVPTSVGSSVLQMVRYFKTSRYSMDISIHNCDDAYKTNVT